MSARKNRGDAAVASRKSKRISALASLSGAGKIASNAMRTVELDDELAELLEQIQKPLDKAAREAMVLELYRRGIISSGKAGELLGMQRVDFIRYAGELGIPFFRMSKEDWEAEKAASRRL